MQIGRSVGRDSMQFVLLSTNLNTRCMCNIIWVDAERCMHVNVGSLIKIILTIKRVKLLRAAPCGSPFFYMCALLFCSLYLSNDQFEFSHSDFWVVVPLVSQNLCNAGDIVSGRNCMQTERNPSQFWCVLWLPCTLVRFYPILWSLISCFMERDASESLILWF
jgi:hypothetical protein